MTRNLKALGLAFVAVFAMSAVAASAAHATEFFHSHKEKTVLTGTTHEGSAVLELPTAPVTCKVGHYEGLAEGTKHESVSLGTTYTTESVTVHPIYTECEAAGKPAVVNTNKCHYKLFAATSGSPAMGNVEINECPSTAPITITVEALGIVIAVENQSIPNCYSSTNNKAEGTEKWDVTVTATCEGAAGAGGVAWKCTKGKAACITAFGASEGGTAKYKDKVTIKGFEYIKGTTGSYEEGPQTGIWKGPEE